jgi:dTDP-glucose 4,6-dehydratase
LTITRLLSGNTALVHGEGTEQREWIYVDDLCKALDCVLHKGKIGSVYNVGSGFRLSNIEVTKKILDIMDLPYTRIEYIANRPGNDTAYRINSNKMKKLYGDSYVTTGFYLGLRKAVEWYSRNQDWYSNVNIDANIYKSNEGYLR